MAISNFIKYCSIFLLLSSCNTYEEDEQIYDFICIKNWETNIKANAKGILSSNVKAKLYYYDKNTSFKKIITADSLFEVTKEIDNGTERSPIPSYALIITPKFVNNKPINDDMILLLNDTIEYKFTNVYFIKDSLKLSNPLGFLGRKIIVRYSLKATVNGKNINYLDTIKSERQSTYISLDASLGKKIK
ncbi:hypothetical protein OIU80_06615 [Flavobacterium sp. LS1R47]|uniref:Uncharacterized protein n=1 Tax=Flavobacterium frigoritolerans TaxID=2987686 RepID=A0A9X2ZM83_9FLAO|nr:hypothetical protein [Flavobacterium frigoritolerans]MCV9931950.1 hypothetical protein [Flavobacterium frigoritolerans]